MILTGYEGTVFIFIWRRTFHEVGEFGFINLLRSTIHYWRTAVQTRVGRYEQCQILLRCTQWSFDIRVSSGKYTVASGGMFETCIVTYSRLVRSDSFGWLQDKQLWAAVLWCIFHATRESAIPSRTKYSVREEDTPTYKEASWIAY